MIHNTSDTETKKPIKKLKKLREPNFQKSIHNHRNPSERPSSHKYITDYKNPPRQKEVRAINTSVTEHNRIQSQKKKREHTQMRNPNFKQI